MDPINSLENWDSSQVILPKAKWLENIDFVVLKDRLERKRHKLHLDIKPIDLSDKEVFEIDSFLHALTGEESIWGRLGRPNNVPSGLPVD